jgi:hypothetical protein
MGKTRRSKADRRKAAQAREDAEYGLLQGQTQPEMRAKLIEISKGLREKYGHTDPPA